ncbi:MAG: D-alanine--D-alanine ligase A [Bacteroidetes bacterium GWC2_33_15]|nr:MAG: D-alanine--D-alanine ligase A [Bacteroidetes bacterium GWA2_33_15]OFX49134.1 MAG: D-alanine--D-alanine ligase A [Bacteroidetes bacterium GWC2_33_15]OFX64902.1 MAG: D-alanine--D-alanine ligase A [Bacteroidetes bacterium GWB2_32_14]OFX68610.1 MAG: D-alanine--D-alanine ligase A [Bacteroidetes bacterium GWD2_33_33]HAN17461.1 D-alanine--D-alanine ligase [Bacteroidales bacterium]
MKKNIAIVAGGDSSEYVISLNSAEQIAKWIDKEKYNVYTVLAKGTEWIVKNDMVCDLILNKDDFSFSLNNQKTTFDCALITIHGTPGEDGKMQGYFDTLHIPYTTSNVLASAITFNKVFSKNYLKPFDIPLARFITLKKGDPIDAEQIIEITGLPCFVKPNCGGSSFGVTKVKEKEKLFEAIEFAYKEDNEVIIEEFLEGTELTCGLVKTKDKTIVFPPTEIVSKNEFFDYEAKYTKGMSEEITPARISKEMTTEIQHLSSQVYDIFQLNGIVRIDYILSRNKLYFMEVNTAPGMSAASIVPQQVAAMGLNMKDIFNLVIEDAFYRHNHK